MSLENIQDTFKENVASVHKLMNFDREVQDIFIEQISDLSKRLVNQQNITNEQMNGQRQLKMLRQIRQNDSLRSRYEMIFNQAVVLSVSYFGSAIHDVLRLCIADAIKNKRHKRLLSDEIKMSISEVVNVVDGPEEAISDLFITKKDISFQDMQSIARVFSDYLSIEIERDAIANDIVCGQACRHAIVHAAGRVDAKLVKQLRSANPRKLKMEVKEGENLKFSPEEVDLLCGSMSAYIRNLCSKIANGGG